MSAILDNPGFKTNSLAANDDGFTGAVVLPFPVNFFGTTYTHAFINNNGNITFQSGQYIYTPYGLAGDVTQPIIAPFFADWDTRSPGSALVTYGTDTVGGRPAFGVNWVRIGYFNRKADKLNSAQLVIIDRSDIAAGDFDFWFNYDRIRWETGDASGGVSGLGGVSAAVGYSNGSGEAGTFFEFAGSRVPGSFLDGNAIGGLTHNSFGTPVLGRYIFQVRSGTPTGGGPPDDGGGPPDGGGGPTVPTGTLRGTILPWASSLDNSVAAVYYTKASAVPAYEIDRIPVGLYSVFLGRCGSYPQMPLVTVQPKRVTTRDAALVALPTDFPDGWLYGWVVDPTTNTPIFGATVTATDGSGNAYTANSDAGGGWLLPLPPGSYALAYDAPGHTRATWPTTYTVTAGCSADTGGHGPTPMGGAGITGYTSDASTQAALAGVSVALVELPAYQTVSGDDGLYGLNDVPAPQAVTLYAAKDGYRARHSSVTLSTGDTSRVDIGLTPNSVSVGNIDGFITDGSGGPIAGALVRCPGVTQTYTNAQGYYLLIDLPVGAESVQAIADGYAPAQGGAVLTSGVTARVNLTLGVLTNAGSLFGQVADAVTGAGIVGAGVTCDALSGTSIARGAYVLSPVPVPPKTHDAGASAAGYYALDMPGVLIGAGQNLELDFGLVSAGTPVGSLHGLVFNARQTTVRLSGALVSCGRFLQAVATSPLGEYRLPYVPADVVYSATATYSGYFPKTYQGVSVPVGVTVELDFPLVDTQDISEGHTLTATVVAAGSGLPIAGALVDLGVPSVPACPTDADGTVAFPQVQDGNYTVSATHAGYRVGSAPASVFGADSAVRIVLSGWPDGYAGGQIYGHVTALLLPPGQGIAGCLVTAQTDSTEAYAVTDGAGFYVIDNAPDGVTIDVSFEDADYVPLTVAGVTVAAKTAVRVDAQLAPWDGRLPDGWKIAYGAATGLSRPPAFVTTTLEATEAEIEARRADTLCFVATADTAALGRYRRVRYGHRTPTLDGNPVLRVALALAPGVSVKSMPGATPIAAPPPKPTK